MKDIREIKDYQIVLLGIFIALGAIISTFLLSNSIVKFQKLNSQAISVTGSASQEIKSDLATFKAYYEVREPDIKKAYAKISYNSVAIKTFLLNNGINEKDIKFSSMSSYPIYKKTSQGYETNAIDGYRLSQNVEVTSKNVDKITAISKNVSSLINQNVEINSNSVDYIISNLDDLKVKMLEAAAKNAKERAESIVKSTGSKIGVMNSAKMGVFQIVPLNSTEVSDYGINDTSSVDKKVIAVVNATFTLR